MTSETKTSWLQLLIRTLSKHWLSLLFVIVICIVFRMPHLSDLTVVIIQLEYDSLAMMAFYVTLLVMAVLISYIHLVFPHKIDAEIEVTTASLEDFEPSDQVLDAVNETDHKPFKVDKNETEEQPKKGKTLKSMIQNINLKDSKEQRIYEQKSKGSYSINSADIEDSDLNINVTVDETPEVYLERLFPKLLATFMIISIAFSVNNTIEELYGSPFLPSYILWVVAGIFLIFTHKKAVDYIKKILRWNDQSGWIPMVVFFISLGGIVVLGLLNTGGTKGDIQSLFLSMILLALLFFTLTVSYNTKILDIKEKYAIPLTFVLILLALLSYIILIISPSFSLLKATTPMVILMICLIGLYTIFTVLRYWSYTSGYPILSIIFFGAIVATVVFAKNDSFKHYEVSAVRSTINPDDRMDLDNYVASWIKQRAQAIAVSTKNEPFPIIMVSAEGGGSRAGHWALLVHSYLYEQNEAYFNEYLFSITGASGGSVGSNLFYAQAYERHKVYNSSLFQLTAEEKKKYKLKYKASKFYQNDYISSSIAGLLGRDLIASISNLSWYDDRGKITEHEWETEFNMRFDKGLLNKPYLHIMPKENDAFIPPIMVTTTTHVQNGRQYIMSPVKFEPNTNNEMLFNDLISDYKKTYPDSMLKRSSAMLLTARFPYISPNGRITGVGQFGDGGYYDNIGGIVTRRLEQALIKSLNGIDSLQGKYRIKHLILKNDTSENYEECPEEVCLCLPEKIDYNSQLLTPALMVIKATFAPADEFVESYPKEFRVESKRTLIPIDSDKPVDPSKSKCETMFRPLIPLGRYLSMDAVRSLEARLEDKKVQEQLRRLLEKNTAL